VSTGAATVAAGAGAFGGVNSMTTQSGIQNAGLSAVSIAAHIGTLTANTQ
jgi:hypothetical protein